MKEQTEKLDLKRIIAAISPQNRGALWQLDIFQSITSTNTYLLEAGKRFLSKRKSGWACLAEEQTQGRGRQGKTWFSPYASNIYCSLAWSFPASFSGLSSLSLVSGVLLIQALEKLGLEAGLGLKWPNDIFFSGRKLAGLLLENLVSFQQNWVVIGIGLNLSLPKETNPAWIAVEEILARSVSRNLVVGVVLDSLLQGLTLFQAEGLKPFLAALRKYDLLLHKEIEVHMGSKIVQGLAQGLSEAGHLCLLTAEGKELQFCYGEVSVRLTSLG